MKTARMKRLNSLWFYLYEMSWKGKFINTENKSVAAWGWDQKHTYKLAQAKFEGVMKYIL